MSRPTQHIANEFLCTDTANIVASYLDEMADILALRTVCTITASITYPRKEIAIRAECNTNTSLSVFFEDVRRLTVRRGCIVASWITTLNLLESVSVPQYSPYLIRMPNLIALYTPSTLLLGNVRLPKLRRLYCTSTRNLPDDFCRQHKQLTHLIIESECSEEFNSLEVVSGSISARVMKRNAPTLRMIYSKYRTYVSCRDDKVVPSYPNLIFAANISPGIIDFAPNLEEYYYLYLTTINKPSTRYGMKVIASVPGSNFRVGGNHNIYSYRRHCETGKNYRRVNGIGTWGSDVIHPDGKRSMFIPFVDDKKALMDM